MSWMQQLYATYEKCQSNTFEFHRDNMPLLPIAHTTQNAQIEITLNEKGEFRRAKKISPEQSKTIIPCTEASGGRTSGKVPHPLCDKLIYLAADYEKYTDIKIKKNNCFDDYCQQLRTWCNSEFGHPKAKIILAYIERQQIIQDLIATQILPLDENYKLGEKWEIKNIKPEDAFVRWSVEIPGDPQSAVNTDSTLFESWTNYYLSTKKNKALCYITGEEILDSQNHPAKIRNAGDKAKIISANDEDGFTYRGRFAEVEQACTIGYDVSQKAHNALRWLIERQGYQKNDLAIVVWERNGLLIPNPAQDENNLLSELGLENDTQSIETAQEFAVEFNKLIEGYSCKLTATNQIILLGLDSATPGRLAIVFYTELTGSEFLQRIQKWHQTCAWQHNYLKRERLDENGKPKTFYMRFVGAPAPNTIAEAAYGVEIDDKLRKSIIKSILSCIINGQKIPISIVNSTIQRASNRLAMKEWEWNRTLSIACALYKKYKYDYEKEELPMALDENRITRDYLYGRLLAVADNIESWALNESGETRPTHATKLMQRFANNPYSTWLKLEQHLNPYIIKLGKKVGKKRFLMDEIVNKFVAEDFMSDKKLSGEFLLGFHSQREVFKPIKSEASQANGGSNNEVDFVEDTDEN